MDVLATIIRKKAERLAQAKRSASLHDLQSLIGSSENCPRDFRSALIPGSGEIRLIAELKKASPSRGMIRPGFDPAEIASLYESKAVSAMSVLTEEDFFMGSLSYLKIVRDVTSKPILRKDFIFDDYQIYESKANHADALLLIAAALEKNQAQEYLHLARELNLGVLFEVHNEEDLEKALAVDAEIIGINNRDLKTLKIDLATTLRLKKEIPEDRVVVSESGIRYRDDVMKLIDARVSAMLVGTSLIASKDIGAKIDELMGKA
ncbi:MAG: indole-3-glycerol phosphate synthase TrpC [Nitrospirae bacterium]|nr:indole-3-glycerol phosphate synthase TrpC [Nitrospirota bacterium]